MSRIGERLFGPRVRFCKVIAGEGDFGCDYIINVPVLKAPDGWSGVSIAMKNHFGSIASPAQLHSTIHDSIAALNSHDFIREKTRLIVVDGIFTSWKWVNGRDQKYVKKTNMLLMSFDPVALDYIGWKFIEKIRNNQNLQALDPQPLFLELQLKNTIWEITILRK